ncbi:MAG TPA: asparagine synthase-related protein [Povalibacter sp.]|nr:asparagine synthase-related protein [Povalibacter sp.]
MKFFGFAGDWPADDSPARRVGLTAPQALHTQPFGADGECGMHCASWWSGHGVSVGVHGRPAWASGTSGVSGNLTTDPAAGIGQAYLERGPKFLESLAGSFALAVCDSRTGQTLLAIDRMGIERLAWARTAQGIVFGDSVVDVARAGGIALTLRPQALYDYLLLHIIPAPGTVFEGVEKLRAGACLTFDASGVRTWRYWQPAFVEHGPADFETLRRDLKQSLRDAVADSGPDEHTGAFLSGGLDSSSVAGMLGQVGPRPARTFSMGFGVESYNELSYARIANRHFGTQGHELEVTAAHIVEVFPKVAAAYDEPFGNSSAVPTYVCARTAAEQGVTHLLAGDGGDEIFGGNERYVRQAVFEHYQRIPRALRGLIEPAVRLIPENSPLTPLRKLRSYVDQARIALPERLETWNFIYRSGPGQVLEPAFLATVNPQAPLDDMREVYAQAQNASLLNHMLLYDWQYTLSDNDLRKVSTMCELAGVRVSYPMLDARVVDVSLRVPSGMKIRGGELRWFYKRALEDFLPGEIIRKSKHGFGLPFGVWLKTHPQLRELIMGHLDSLRSRGIVARSFIDSIIARHRDGDASFYGYPIWDMAMLDAWMTTNRVSL